MRNPLWAPEYTGRKPAFNDRETMRLNPGHPLNQGLVALWLFNEHGGTQAFECVGRAGGTLSNALWSAGKYGSSVTTDGTNYVGSITLGTALDDKPLSIITRIRPISLPNTAPRIIDRVYNGQFALYIRAADTLLAFGGKNNADATIDSPFIGLTCPIGEWHTFGISWPVSGTSIHGFKDGAYVAAIAFAGPGLKASSAETKIGQSAANNRGANSEYDYLAIYNVILSSAKQSLAALYPYGTPDNPRFLVEPQRTWFVPSGEAGTVYYQTLDAATALLSAVDQKQTSKVFSAT